MFAFIVFATLGIFLSIPLNTLIHELGHVMAIFLAKYILNFKGNLNIHISLGKKPFNIINKKHISISTYQVFNGFTSSSLVAFLVNHKNSLLVRLLMRFIAVNGFLFSFVFYYLIFTFHEFLNIGFYFGFSIAWFLNTLVSFVMFGNDLKYFVSPHLYTYKH